MNAPLRTRLRESRLVKSGETVLLDIGNGPSEVSTGDIVQSFNRDGDEAAEVLDECEKVLGEYRELLGRGGYRPESDRVRKVDAILERLKR